MVSILMETLVVKGLILNEFKAYGFLMISRGVKVNQTAPNCLILNAKFGNVFSPSSRKTYVELVRDAHWGIRNHITRSFNTQGFWWTPNGIYGSSPNFASNINSLRPNPGRREKISLNFYFHTSLWCSKKFYESL